ncbi:aminotransferase class V-fold PLP-dependent enzyme [Actinomadura alba]|uniref:Aminotransferase class V-fold PLP-dependent enzyme n=1 Tax=Actinomadura alba TaxID=406431 RepID=A0ABR7M277_9ACTN|nr:aminotransferase class V-fold PLP-dependent enzyme [Actinomadura alba]MBC6471120.1 aminotransferase class V-fold PLP-dependent enzyme [Actinomadura alba]
MTMSRRRMLSALGGVGAAVGRDLPGSCCEFPSVPAGTDPEQPARDEEFWRTVARTYRVSPEFTNLENGYYGIMAEPVRRAYHRNVDRLNSDSSRLLRSTYKAEAEQIRQRIAAVAGVSAAEIALTRGGTEALQNLIAGYRRLQPGDTVMYADLDYQSMQYAMDWLRDRRGVRVEKIVIPEPATHEAVLEVYTRALRDHPRVRLLLLSHMNNRTGLVLPVRDIVDIAHTAGTDVIVDAAHSWGQLDFTIPDLGADFVGCSLHKWIGAPLGTGFLYIRKERLADIDPAFADQTYPATDIRSRVHSGTLDFAAVLTVPQALDLHRRLGAPTKQARLRFLRDRWVDQVKDVAGVQILTPDDPAMYGAITSFRISGRTTQADNEQISHELLQRHRIFTVRRGGPARGDCVRVTPALFTSRDDIDGFAAALRGLARRLHGSVRPSR